MYKLFTDKTELFECNVKLEGASLKSSVARIIIESDDVNLLFNGTIDSNGKCTIPIKKLKGLLGENTKGNLKLEVIADDTYFVPWSSDFSVEAARKVTVEVKSQNAELIVESAPKVQVSNVKNSNQDIPFSIQEHVVKLVSLLLKENIKLDNLTYKKDKLNNIVATYLQENTIKETEKPELIQGILNKLPK
jgi:hypothetical protein